MIPIDVRPAALYNEDGKPYTKGEPKMTFIEKFEEIKKKIGAPDLSKLNESFAVQVNMTDADCGGAFYIAYIGGNLAIEPYDYHDHTAMIYAKSKDLIDALIGKVDMLAAVMSGKIEVYGNIDHVTALATLHKPRAKRAAAKKPAAKKAAEKKPAEKTPAAKKAPAKKTAEKTAEKKAK